MRKSTIHDVIHHIEMALDAAEDLDADGQCDGAREAAINAISDIRRGAYEDAILALEREFLPKWKDKADAEAAYRKAMQ